MRKSISRRDIPCHIHGADNIGGDIIIKIDAGGGKAIRCDIAYQIHSASVEVTNIITQINAVSVRANRRNITCHIRGADNVGGEIIIKRDATRCHISCTSNTCSYSARWTNFCKTFTANKQGSTYQKTLG